MSSEINPYASPAAPSGSTVLADLADADLVRKEHARHELSVQSMGSLYYLSAVVFLAAGLGISLMEEMALPAKVTIAAIALLIAAAMFGLGWGLRRLKSWTRWPFAILSALGLLNPPLGTLLGAYGLYLALSKKGAVVFSPAYQDVMRQTPHLKPKSSMVLAIVSAVVIAVLIVAAIVAFLSISGVG